MDDGHLLGLGVELQQEIHGAGQVAAGGGIGHVDQGIAFLISRIGGRPGGDHNFLILLGDDRGGVRQPAAVRADQKVGIVAADEPGIEFLDPVLVALIIIILGLNLDLGAVGHLDAAGLVDLFYP